ncbi:MAG TPA: DUF87 domain-containing protein [Aquifex aeolicus]|uniref:DUF87 domain-containing protein n=1 Tax=Aquifex aeolicus TaxID=63363 RepID=A0A7C5L6J9_AQUAO|nr:DUF87 domain-containing protein [Aquifex aeolicus]
MEILRGEEIGKKLAQMFSRAKESVRVCSAWVKGEILKELADLVGEGVRVELVVRVSSYEDLKITDPEVFRVVRKKGGRVYLHRKLHAKFVLVDGSCALLGSANLTRSGVGEEGNVETAVYTEDPDTVRNLEEVFESVKSESYDPENTVAFLVSLDSSREGVALLLRDLQEQTYVRIPLDDGGFLLGRISEVKRSRAPEEGFPEEILTAEEEVWKTASLLGRLEEEPELRLARLEILGEYEKERDLFKTPVGPVRAGAPVEVLDAEDRALRSILHKNHSGYSMRFPVYIGKLQGTEVRAFLDMGKVIPMHMAVLGATGSGKTTFVKKVLRNFGESARIYVFDIYGEYYEDLRDRGNVREIQIPNVLLPLDAEDMKNLLREGGLTLTERSTDERELMAFFRRHLKPDLGRTALGEQSLETLVEKAIAGVEEEYLKDALGDLLEFWRRTYGDESVRKQPEAVRELRESLKAPEGTTIYSFKNVDITETRVNVAGLILREILYLSKEAPADRLVVLEEAHNFAPERGFGDVPAGRENPAFSSTRRIAMEGRKLRLGLIAVTQRPAGISKFVLSQLNTQVIFKLLTRNDLEAVSVFFEPSREDIFRLLPFLKPGTAYIGGLAVPFSFLFQMEEIPYW